MDVSTPGFPVHHQLLELNQTHVHRVGDAIQLSHPLSSPSPTMRVFSNESLLCIGWPKYWSFSFSISPSNEYSGLISFRTDWDIYIGEGVSIPPVHFCREPKTVKNRGVQCILPTGTQAVEEGGTHVGSSPLETSFFLTSLVFFHKLGDPA